MPGTQIAGLLALGLSIALIVDGSGGVAAFWPVTLAGFGVTLVFVRLPGTKEDPKLVEL